MDPPKIVLGLDFGTTFTGVAYGTSAGDVNNIEIVTKWPESSGASHKTPTAIAYLHENQERLEEDAWGFQVSAKMSSYSWFKLLLSDNMKTDKYKTQSSYSNARGLLQLPRGRSAEMVCEDYLKLVWEFVDDQLKKRFTEDVRNTPIEVVVTVPAIWSFAAKRKTSEAVKAAGFASGPSDSLKLILEPEAAAISVLHENLHGASVDPIVKGDKFVVCDCGGGTADLTTYEVITRDSQLEFQELIAGEGGPYGSTFVDRNFENWMCKEFKSCYTSLSRRKRGLGSGMMQSFEKAKLNFGPKTMEKNAKVKIENVDMVGVQESKFYDPEEHTIILPCEVMQSFFDPVVDGILHKVEAQFERSKKRGLEVSRIVLAGGFGDSSYLHNRLQTWCDSQEKKIKLSCPPNCQAAIVKGAVIRGLLNLKPRVRIARFHYGFGWSAPFREGVDPEEDHWIDKQDGRKMCYRRIKWFVSKGQELSNNWDWGHNIERQVLRGEGRELQVQIDLFSCHAERPPDFEYSQDPKPKREGCIEISFTRGDSQTPRPRKRKRALFQPRKRPPAFTHFYYTIYINMNAEEGLLSVRVFNERRELGSDQIKLNFEE
ncbi:hsp70-like protein [Phyllosticta capitalensis]|uniref:Hsp70-like protein n=1 Tax=Phyllosticta capitalensis TaxID=121624 RepID=A0ABR1YNZ3_9PEZI